MKTPSPLHISFLHENFERSIREAMQLEMSCNLKILKIEEIYRKIRVEYAKMGAVLIESTSSPLQGQQQLFCFVAALDVLEQRTTCFVDSSLKRVHALGVVPYGRQ